MYTRWAEQHGFSVETDDYQAGDEAGIKSVTLTISGHNAYGYLRSEKGVHRLVRISPFDSAGRRHTSFCSHSDRNRRFKSGTTFAIPKPCNC